MSKKPLPIEVRLHRVLSEAYSARVQAQREGVSNELQAELYSAHMTYVCLHCRLVGLKFAQGAPQWCQDCTRDWKQMRHAIAAGTCAVTLED